MKKLLVLALAAMVAVIAAPKAEASVQNVKISGSVDNTYLYRRNFNFGFTGGDDQDQDVFITQAILRVDADLTDQVMATIALINERAWEADASNDAQDIDILLAYVTLREMLYSPLTLVVGRQDFRYGNSFIFDSAGANNVAPAASGINGIANDLTKQTTLDAVRAILDYNPLTVELVFSIIDEGAVGNALSDSDDRIYVTGVNATYELGDELNSVVEGYLWKKVDKSTSSTISGAKSDVIKIVGIRGSTNPIEGLNLQAEVAHQSGNKVTSGVSSQRTNRTRNAWAFQGIVNYQIPEFEEYNPVFQYVYTKVTGEDDTGATDGNEDFNGWDAFFESQGGGTIYNTLFDLTNLHIHTWSLTAEPMEDVTAKLSIHALWEERNTGSSTFSLRDPAGLSGTATNRTVTSKDVSTWLGKEVDLDLTYDYTEDVQVGASLGYFFPGSVFSPAGSDNDGTAKQVLVNLNVAF